MERKDFPENEIVETLKELINFKSINPPGNEGEICNYVYNFFIKNNIDVKKVQIENDRFVVVAHIKGIDDYQSTIFTGHLDVVPVSFSEKDKWQTDPFNAQIIDDKIYGRGASDMKSGVCVGMHLMKYLHDKKITPKYDVYFIATYDEEDFMTGSKLLQTFKDGKNVIVMEPTDLSICDKSNGRTYGLIKFFGESGHGSIRNDDQNAIMLAHDFISMMNEVTFPNNSFWQVVSINAGVEPCVIPDYCVIKIDCRLDYDFDLEIIWKKIEEISERMKVKHPKFKYEIEIIDKREGWQTPHDNYLIEKIKTAYENNNKKYDFKTFTGTTDGTILRRNNRNVIIAGPGKLSLAHKANEYVEISALKEAFKIYLDYVL